jgi:putative intracellular protease/amidase
MRASKRPQSKTTMPSRCPEGAWNPDQLRANPAVLSFLQKLQATGKPLGALCHGSQVFLSAKLTKGRKAMGYWSIMEDMANAGATVLDQPVVLDENVITSALFTTSRSLSMRLSLNLLTAALPKRPELGC